MLQPKILIEIPAALLLLFSALSMHAQLYNAIDLGTLGGSQAAAGVLTTRS